MKHFAEITILILGVHFVYTKPIAGINFKRQIEVNINPTPFKSLEFIFEKWSRFGKFGLIHKIAKRDTNDILDYTKLSSFGDENLKVVPVNTKAVSVLPTSEQNVVVLSTVKPLQSSEKVPTDTIDKVVIIPVVEATDEIVQPVKPFLEAPGETYLLSTPVEATTPPATSASTIKTTVTPDVNPFSPPLLYTNILQTLNIPQMKETNVQTPEIRPVSKTENQNFIIRGSKFAMYFGSMLLRILSQYFAGSRVPLGNFPAQDSPLL